MASTSAGAPLVRAVPRGLPPRRIAEALFPDAAIHYVAGFDAMADLLDGFADQRPSTCGAYVARYVLGPLGFAVHDGIPTTREDYLAFLAGTVLDPEEAATVEAARADADREGLDDPTAAARFGDAWYGWPLRVSGDLTVVGTSPWPNFSGLRWWRSRTRGQGYLNPQQPNKGLELTAYSLR